METRKTRGKIQMSEEMKGGKRIVGDVVEMAYHWDFFRWGWKGRPMGGRWEVRGLA